MQKFLLPQRQPLASVQNLPAFHPIAAPTEKRRNIDQLRKVDILKLDDSFSVANDDDELDLILTAISKIVVESVSTTQPDIAESILKLLRKAKTVKGHRDADPKRNNAYLKCQPLKNTESVEHTNSNDAISAGPSSARAAIISSSNLFDFDDIGESNRETVFERDSLPSGLIHWSSSTDKKIQKKSSGNETANTEITFDSINYGSIISSPPTDVLDGTESGILHWNVPDEEVKVLQLPTSSNMADIDVSTTSMGIETENKSKRNIKKKEKKKPTSGRTTRRRSCLPTIAETYLLHSSDDIAEADIKTIIEPASSKVLLVEEIVDSNGVMLESTSSKQQDDVQDVDHPLPQHDDPACPSSARKRRASMDDSPSSHLSEGRQHLSCGESILQSMADSESLSSGLIHWSSSLENNIRADFANIDPMNDGHLAGCPDNSMQQDDVLIHSQMFEGEDLSYNEVGPGILHWDTVDVDNCSQPIIDSEMDLLDSCVEVDSRPRRTTSRDKKKEKRKPTGAKAARRRSCLPPIAESHVLTIAEEDVVMEAALNESSLSSRFAATSAEDDSFLGGILHWECTSDISERTSHKPAPVNSYPVEPTPIDSSKEVVLTYDESMNIDADVMKMLMEQEDLKSFPPSAISDMKVTASESHGRSRRRASLSAESFIKSLTNASHRGSPQATATLAALSAATAADLIAEGESEPPNIMARNKRRKKTKLLENVVEKLPDISLEKELERTGVNSTANQNHQQDNSGETIGAPFASSCVPALSIERMLGVPLPSISSNILHRLEVDSDVVSNAESIINKATSSSSSSTLVNESSLLCIAVVASLTGIDGKQVESLVANLRILCEVPMSDEKIVQYSLIEKAFHSINSNGLTLSQSQSSSSKGITAKKTVRFNAVDGSAIDPPNDRRPLSWISLLLEAKKVHLLSGAIARFLHREGESSCARRHDLSVLCAVLLFLTTEKSADIVVRNVCKQRNRVSPNFVSSAELQTISQFLLGEISLQLSSGPAALCLERGLRQSNACLRKRSSWMLSAVVRYQLRWCLDLPPPCISVPSAQSRDGSAVTEDLYSTYRSRLHHLFEILQPLSEEALRTKPAYSVDELIAALNFPSTQRSQKAMAFLNTVKEFFCARPFANLSFLFAEALRQVSALLSLICSSCGGDAPLLRELAPLDCLCQLRVDSTTAASALVRFIQAADKDSRFDICQVMLIRTSYRLHADL